MAILSFLGNTFIARRVVEGEYPGAQLYVIDATFDPPKPKGSTNVNELNKLRGIFNATKDGKQGTAFINSTEWGEWGPVEFVPEYWPECEPIPMPNEEYMEPQEAHKKMVAKGYDQPFLGMVFRWPLNPTVKDPNEPKYIFLMGNNFYVLVGAISGDVTTEQDSEFQAQGSLKADA